MAVDFDIVERASKAGPELSVVKVAFRPVLGEPIHSNLFRMQLYPTARRILVDSLGRQVTDHGVIVVPNANGLFPAENPGDPYRREIVSRNNDAEMAKNIEEYWERKLRAAAAGKSWPRHHNTTLNLQVGASADDAEERVSTAAMQLNNTAIRMGSQTFPRHCGYRWTGVSGLSGATIDSATLRFIPTASDSGDFIGDWFAHDAEAPGTFTSTASNISDTAQRPRTTATCEGDGTDFTNWSTGVEEPFTGDGINTIAEIIQELADSYDPSAIVLLHIYTSGNGERNARAWDGDSSNAARFDIDFTEPLSGPLGAVQLDTGIIVGLGRTVGY